MSSYNGSSDVSKVYDLAVIGAGLSGLMLVQALLDNPGTAEMKILLLERSVSEYAPRTWCFWEKEDHGFDDLVEQRWDRAEFFLEGEHLRVDLRPYVYKMIDAERYREKAWRRIAACRNVDVKQLYVRYLAPAGDGVVIRTEGGMFGASLVFDSRFDKWVLQQAGVVLYQQFAGWYVDADRAVFDEGTARLMDFRMPQEGAVAFVYVLPTGPATALVEYTLFTSELRPRAQLEAGLRAYLDGRYAGVSFSIGSHEEGVIPMSDFPVRQKSPRIIPIGTAGGCTKPSSGYTFAFVRQHTEDIIDALNKGRLPVPFSRLVPGRFTFYDRVLLRILSEHPEKGAEIFFRLFKRNAAERVLPFMGNSSTLWEELGIFSSLPIPLFLQSAYRTMFPKEVLNNFRPATRQL